MGPAELPGVIPWNFSPAGIVLSLLLVPFPLDRAALVGAAEPGAPQWLLWVSLLTQPPPLLAPKNINAKRKISFAPTEVNGMWKCLFTRRIDSSSELFSKDGKIN